MPDVFKGSTSHSRSVALVDSTTGLPKTGIAHTDVTGSYQRTRADRVAVTMASLAAATTAFTSGGWFEVDATNQPGLYRWDIPDAAFATGAEQVVATAKATGCRTEHIGFDLVDWNNQVAALPNAAAGAANGLPLGDASGDVTIGGYTVAALDDLAGAAASLLPTASQNAAAVWEEPLSVHTTVGGAGKTLAKLNDARMKKIDGLPPIT